MMIETGVKIIKLANVRKGTHHQHKIEDSHPKIYLLTWYEIVNQIETYGADCQPQRDIDPSQNRLALAVYYQHFRIRPASGGPGRALNKI